MRNRILPLAWASALVLLSVGFANADVIDGDWCATDGRTLTIDGPKVTTPGGAAISGDYTRHSFAYVVPAGERGAGSRVTMQLLNDTNVRVNADPAPEIWHRCAPSS